MARDQSQAGLTDLTRQTQALFEPIGAMAPGFEQVMKAQKGMLEQVEAFNRHWLERRQEAFDTALETMTEMQSAEKPDPAAAMRAIADWQAGSVARLTADLQEWMTLCLQATQAAATAQSAATSSDSNEGKATGPKDRSAKSGSKSEHATPV